MQKRRGLLHVSNFQKDALMETANICTATSAKALYDIIDSPVILDIPELYAVHSNQLPHIVPNPDYIFITSYSHIKGDISGNIAVFLTKEAALRISVGVTKRKQNIMTPKSLEMLKEIGSIMFGHYLTGINLLLGTERIIHDSPRIITTYGDTLLDLLSIDLHLMKHALVIKTNIYLSKKRQRRADGLFILVLNIDSVEELIRLIKKKVKR